MTKYLTATEVLKEYDRLEAEHNSRLEKLKSEMSVQIGRVACDKILAGEVFGE